MTPQTCPICNRLSLRREDFQISAAINGENRNVSGLAAFICEIAGHIFFVLCGLQTLNPSQSCPP